MDRIQADGVKLSEPTILKNQKCPFCLKDSLTIWEYQTDVPWFGKTYLFSAECSNCEFKITDIEFEQQQEPVKWTFVIESEEDLKVLVVKSAQATIKIDNIVTIEPGVSNEGFITTIEGVLKRIKDVLQGIYENEEDKEEKNKIWAKIKKINRIMWNETKGKIIIEDPTGNSAIISKKSKKEKLKIKQK